MVKMLRNSPEVSSVEQNTQGASSLSQSSTSADPQVKLAQKYKPRRSYGPACKARLLAEYEACSGAARGEFLRREGLYYATISTWRREAEGRPKGQGKRKENPRSDHLARENARLKKKLEQAEAIIDLQKKISTLFGLSDHPPGSSEET